MGQLAASIAHEVNQPIGAVRNSAYAALRFLKQDPPDLEEVREAIECVVDAPDRSGPAEPPGRTCDSSAMRRASSGALLR